MTHIVVEPARRTIIRDARDREDLEKGVTGPGRDDRVVVSGRKSSGFRKEGAALTTPRGSD